MKALLNILLALVVGTEGDSGVGERVGPSTTDHHHLVGQEPRPTGLQYLLHVGHLAVRINRPCEGTGNLTRSPMMKTILRTLQRFSLKALILFLCTLSY